MFQTLKSLWADENGFIVSSELVLVSTLVGLAMVVGLSELSCAINAELSDVAQGFARCNWNDCDNDWDEDHDGVWDSEPQHEQSGGDFYGNN